MTIHLNTALKIGAGACLTGMAIGLLRVSHPISILGLAVAGQALAWMPGFVSRCLRSVKGEDRLSKLPKDSQVEIQTHLDRKDVNALLTTNKVLMSIKPAVVLRRFKDNVEAGIPITLQEIRELIAFYPTKMKYNTKPFELKLQHTDINDDELQDIIARFPMIDHIDAWGCKGLTDSSLQSLAGMTHLKKLNLGWLNITDRGLRSLGSLTNLEKLNLLDCRQITDEGLRSLGSLTNLRTLNLRLCNQITDKGLLFLGSLKNLKKLLLTDQATTHAGHDALVAAIPNLNIKSLSSRIWYGEFYE